MGNLLAQNSATLGAGAIVDGRVIALDDSSAVTLNANTMSRLQFREALTGSCSIQGNGRRPDQRARPRFGRLCELRLQREAQQGAATAVT